MYRICVCSMCHVLDVMSIKKQKQWDTVWAGGKTRRKLLKRSRGIGCMDVGITILSKPYASI